VEGAESVARIREEGLRLAPWHLQVGITPELTTRDLYEAEEETDRIPGFYDPGPHLAWLFGRLYPDGLRGSSVLDCACNNGAYLFAAKEAGAGPCFGFDARDHWIEQARFLAENREGPSDDMHFETCDLYELPARDLERFDLTICTGVLYHLPDPIRALEVIARLTGGVMVLSSAAVPGWPDNALVAADESKEVLSGTYGFNWYPSGPGAALSMLWWLGFEDAVCTNWFAEASQPGIPESDRFVVVAFRDAAAAEAWYTSGPPDEVGRMRERVIATVPPRATVLVATRGEEHLLELTRPAWHFPQNGAGAYVPASTDSRALMAQLDELRARGAEYLVIPRSSLGWLEDLPDFRQYLELRYGALSPDPERDACVIYKLTGSGMSALTGSLNHREYFDYRKLVRRTRETVDETLPAGRIVLIMTRGDDDLLNLDGREGWHFPRDDRGGYSGSYPADSAAAIAHLEELRARGAEYLVVPRTSLWWLDHFAEFGRHLEGRYPVVARDADTCTIYALAP
jgi:SAM-dependent methyltransferase